MSLSAIPVDQTTDYAKRVESGEIIAGKFVKAACKRHLSDLESGGGRGILWNVSKAERAIRFFPTMLTVTEGAAEGLPFKLLPWHVFVVGCLFGWVRADGLRRFRWAWLETGKGQAKSPLMAAIGLYMMGFNGKRRSQVYAIASDKDQANVLFKDAVAMCRASMPDSENGESLESEGHVIIRGTGDNAWKIEHRESNSIFQSMASVDSISGPKPSCVLADEIHEFKSSKAIQLWKASIDKMSGDPLMILGTNTPSSDQIVGTEYSEMFQRVVSGDADDDTAFAFIARVDDGDEPFAVESCWRKSLPALGITFPIENVRSRVNTAKLLLSEALATRRLYFGIPVGSSGFWIAEDAWNAAQGSFDVENMAGNRCWAALDLSRKNDLTAITVAWRVSGVLYAKNFYWTTKTGLADRERDDKVPYCQWVDNGLIDAVEGAVIDKEFVAGKLKNIHDRFNIDFVAFDGAGISDFMSACEKIGFDVWRYDGKNCTNGTGLKMISHGQGTRITFEDRSLCMPRSIERLEDVILKKTIIIDKNPVTTMCAANAQVITDAMNNKAFDKKRSRGRIDGLVTLAMAVGASMNNVTEPTASFWEGC